MKNLFIVGAQRSGSTYLYSMFDGHPEVAMAKPVRPEPKFFLNESLVAKGKDHYEAAYFPDRTDNTLYLGEKGTSYIESVGAARNIKAFYPEARVLIILRDPVQRAYSNYRFSVEHQLESLAFTDALLAEPDRLRDAKFQTSVNPFAYRKRGFYMEYIEGYLGVFHPDQMRVLIFEELLSEASKIQELYRWLGLDDAYVPGTLGQVINPSTVQSEEPQEVFKELALGYRDSNARLEQYLGRSIPSWAIYG